MQLMGLVFGVIQAYVFAVLALVYISSAASIQQESRGLRASRPAPAAAEAAATPSPTRDSP
jgi:hypothetical protein